MTDRAVRALVVAGGEAPTPALLAGVGTWDLAVAADSGLDHAAALGVAVDLVVGDLDSVSPERLDSARMRASTASAPRAIACSRASAGDSAGHNLRVVMA